MMNVIAYKTLLLRKLMRMRWSPIKVKWLASRTNSRSSLPKNLSSKERISVMSRLLNNACLKDRRRTKSRRNVSRMMSNTVNPKIHMLIDIGTERFPENLSRFSIIIN